MFDDPYWNYVETIYWMIFRDSELLDNRLNLSALTEIIKVDTRHKEFKNHRSVEQAIKRYLITGDLNAIGIKKGSADFQEIDKLQWLILKLYFGDDGKTLAYQIKYISPDSSSLKIPADSPARYNYKTLWENVLFRSKDILDIWVPREEKRDLQSESRSILEITAPIQQDSWFKFVIHPSIVSFQNIHKYTPNVKELWTHIIETPPANAGVSYIQSRNNLQMDGKVLTWRAFQGRYNRYFPKK